MKSTKNHISPYVLGISAYYHDSSAVLVKGSKILAAVQEERFSRKKNDSSFPKRSIEYCLARENIKFNDLEKVVYYENSAEKFNRLFSSYSSAGFKSFFSFCKVFPTWIKWKRNVLATLKQDLLNMQLGELPALIASSHHYSHAASAFYPSPFNKAAILCIDSVGEWHTTTIWKGDGSSIELVKSISYPHSLGLLYSAFTYYCGFKVDSGEYKLMGLAPYGKPNFVDLIKKHLVNIRDDGSFSLNMKYFEFHCGRKMINKKFERLFGSPVRKPESEITQKYCDIAASIQKVTEEIVINLAKVAKENTGCDNLCMAGGVALNCVANGVLDRANIFESLWIQPAAGDSGGALGAALAESIKLAREITNHKTQDTMEGSLLGPEFSDKEISDFLNAHNYPYHEHKEECLYEKVSQHLTQGKIVGWFQGRMEFGPRALGSRSILGDPRNSNMQSIMNLKIKFRESFRPFAPAVLYEDVDQYFEINKESPYMLMIANVKNNSLKNHGTPSIGCINQIRSSLPAITHVDYSARVQTVTENSNLKFYNLLKKFKEKTGCPVLVNTSFNVRGEPIVCSPEDAYRCFMATNMDVLVLGRNVLKKTKQPNVKYTASALSPSQFD